MIDIAGLGQANHGMNEHVGLACSRRSNRQLPMGTVHGIPGLESNDSGPAQFSKMVPQLGRGVSKGSIVVVTASVDDFDFAANVVLLHVVEKILYRRMFFIATKNLLGFLLPKSDQMSLRRTMGHRLTYPVCIYHRR
jgi:hypothetical protein